MNFRLTHALKNKILQYTAIILLIMVTVAGISVKNVNAFEILPTLTTFGTATEMLNDVIKERGFQIPQSTVESQPKTEEADGPMSVDATLPVKYTKNYTVTAYNSVPWQTDSTPCIAADGSDICKLRDNGDMSCAAALPFGTKIYVPGFGTCTVRDRLAPKYSYRIDLYFGGADQIQAARNWGKKHIQVSILES